MRNGVSASGRVDTNGGESAADLFGGRLNPASAISWPSDPTAAYEAIMATVHPGWIELWQGFTTETGTTIVDLWHEVIAKVASRARQETILPAPTDVARAFATDPEKVRVVIIGQDPYPTAGHGMGLSFSVHSHIRPLPRSLSNIFTELVADIGGEAPHNGDLRSWVDQGVLLLNTTLTVVEGKARAHARLGWPELTRSILASLIELELPVVTIAWGNDAISTATSAIQEATGEKVHLASPGGREYPGWAPVEVPMPMKIGQLGTAVIVASAHPSPLSARRGFFGSRPFSTANAALNFLGAESIDWRL